MLKMVLDERIYVGVFSSSYFSSGWLTLPVVEPLHAGIAADSTNDVEFIIGFDGSASGFGLKAVPDPRNDKRIVAAVEKLFPVTNNPSKSLKPVK
jgi:hypothetical protein